MSKMPNVTIPSSAPQRGPQTAKKRGNLNKMHVSATFYIPRPTHRHLKEIMAIEDTSLQQILVEALDMWLAQRGSPPFYPEGWDHIGKKATRDDVIRESREQPKE
jgi:hypothetical protein